ncbi:MAG: amidase domain-containing protein [Sporolactobacillus sp.]|uniref:amidase domain-containing protein n=1 Tax=Sporolactobacillus sp. STSJ-5 TaxID=2965076 RepID=UPI002103A77A|nr:amidase domain-containing protein [Sporolactobacillus sp. STSJ-5]
MDWKNAFQNHLTMLGDYWVGNADPHKMALAPEELKRLMNKTKALNDQQAEIEHAVVQAQNVQTKDKREDLVIDYSLHTQWLIKKQNDFFLEERLEDRQAVVRSSRLVSDTLAPLAAGEEQPLPRESGDLAPADVRSRSYDRLAAVRYADLWWNRRNPHYPIVSDDCTNFISQCLHEGGIRMWGNPIRNRGWWQVQTNWSFSWTVANSLCMYLSKPDGVIGAIERAQASELVPGDVICYDFEGDGRWNHNTMVTAMDASGEPLVNAHTYDAYHRPWPYTDSPAYTANIRYKFFHIKDHV